MAEDQSIITHLRLIILFFLHVSRNVYASSREHNYITYIQPRLKRHRNEVKHAGKMHDSTKMHWNWLTIIFIEMLYSWRSF